jgi:hypothetical protein
MYKKNYVWSFNGSSLMSGIDAPLSLEYHLPFQKLKVTPEELIDARLWLVLTNGNQQYLFAFVTPISIERYTDGTYKEDYLLSADQYDSVRLMPRTESRDRWLVNLEASPDGLRICTDGEQSSFEDLIKKNALVSFSDTSDAILKTIPRTGFADIVRAVPDQLQRTLRALAFGDAVRSKGFSNSLSVMGGIALEILRKINERFNSQEAIALMASLDPFMGGEIPVPKAPEDILGASQKVAPTVDIFLTDMDPDKISPRIFVARSSRHSNDWLEKTAQAEETHERILKDLVLYMRDDGFSLSKSRSFDLYAQKREEHLLIEVKSSTYENLVAQGEKAIIQLLRYSSALGVEDSHEINFVLLLQYQPQESVLNYISSMAQRVGFSLWLYDENRAWPDRVFTLDPKKSLPFS